MWKIHTNFNEGIFYELLGRLCGTFVDNIMSISGVTALSVRRAVLCSTVGWLMNHKLKTVWIGRWWCTRRPVFDFVMWDRGKPELTRGSLSVQTGDSHKARRQGHASLSRVFELQGRPAGQVSRAALYEATFTFKYFFLVWWLLICVLFN